ncbi:MAG TPA: GMC family oxidoreductase [Thermoanaerobaculia bacterium]|jgi:cholesterol oxidase|nr:GMC family oxidoreductase [Thermoanaerobaculia bacterium]
MSNQFDAVIVGSGFGGSVVAYRLAEAGMRVRLLERGKAYPPGSFPRSPAGMSTNFWDPSDGMFGLYSVWSFKGIDALVSAGLGGGSLIYANVLLRKDRGWFEEDGWQWPVNAETLDPHYDAVEKIMKPQRYPLDYSEHYATWKTRTMKQVAGALGMSFETPPLAVTFGNDEHHPVPGQVIVEEHRNYHDADRLSCVLVGECNVGCNSGSKNSLDYTYISAAQRAKANISILSEVKAFRPLPNGGYEIDYVVHHPEKEGDARKEKKKITADRLILSAGALGTPYLLLSNRGSFPAFNRHLGTKFCGNGDLLGFMLKCTDPKTGLRYKVNASRAPVITGSLRADTPDRRGFYIQDGGNPEFLNWLIEATEVPGALKRGGKFVWDRLMSRIIPHRRTEISREIRALFGDCDLASSTFPVLGMGRDVADGNFTLGRHKILELDWSMKTSKKYFDSLRGKMKEMAKLIHADFQTNPTWYLKRVVTVHPLGGAPMGHDPSDGFVDSFGKVFGYEGLYVADGSVMPGPVGPNPSLTIAAMADRTAEHILKTWTRRGPT